MKMNIQKKERGKSATKYEILLKSVYHVDYMSPKDKKKYGLWINEAYENHFKT